MEGLALNTLGYTGIVTISLYNRKHNKKELLAQVHNTGARSLFSFFTNCLMGDYALAERERPTKIMLLQIDDSESPISVSSVSGFISTLTPPERVVNTGTSTGETVNFSFIIPRALIQNIGSEYSCNAIGLYAEPISVDQPQEFSAYCKIDLNTDSVSWDASSVLVLDWALNISNVSELE